MVRTYDERIAEAKEKMAQYSNLAKELARKQKEQDKNARKRRIYARGELLESFIPDAETLTDEQIKASLEKTITSSYALKALEAIQAQAISVASEKSDVSLKQDSSKTVEKAEKSKGEGA